MTTTTATHNDNSPRRYPQWTLGDRLAKARTTAGIASRDLANHFGVGRNTITNYEHDHTEPSINTVMEWAELTGVDPTWLLGLNQ